MFIRPLRFRMAFVVEGLSDIIKFNTRISSNNLKSCWKNLGCSNSSLWITSWTTVSSINLYPYAASNYDPIQNILITSSFWSHRESDIETMGLKTDVLLAAYGYKLMDETVVHEVIHNDEFEHPKFFQQLFKLLEDPLIT